MKVDRARLVAVLAPGLALGLWLLLGLALLWATLDDSQRAAVGGALAPLADSHGILPFAWWLAGAVAAAFVAARLYDRLVRAPSRLAEAARTLAANDSAQDFEWSGASSASLNAQAAALAELARQRATLRADVATQVETASRSIAQERDRLGALMAELQQSVVVCNLDGRILLYNARARLMSRRLATGEQGAATAAVAGADAIGLGRSVYALVEEPLIAHALQTVQRRMARGAPPAMVAARFVTATASGRLLRVSLAPVRAASGDATEATALSGYVLLLDDFTDEYHSHSQRDHDLLELTETSRASLASMQAALDMLDYPDLDAPTRERFSTVVRDEVSSMSSRLSDLAARASQDLMTRWPLQEMLGADLLSAASQRIEADTDCSVSLSQVDDTLWLNVDSFSLIQALAFLSARLVDEFGLRTLQLRLERAGARAHLDLLWSGRAASTETVMGWQMSAMDAGDERSPLSVRDVVERHGGEVWFERERAQQVSFFRFLLPLAAGADAADPNEAVDTRDSRPEFYDFDLFAIGEGHRELDDVPLSALTYTVFDTETTGLNPAEGDEILQLGAVRILNGKVLRGESYEQLVDPGRSIPEASIPFHGIRPDMVAGKPSIAQVLPVFHAFVADTVMVGHNAAFDMRFLQVQADKGGPRFVQPVLDTLLLSSVVHPNAESHSLEAIGERLGVTVAGRHTALGDAQTTAEVFLKLLPLLRREGIETLGQAREAAQKSYYARLRY